MDRLTEAAGMLRISGIANRADRADAPRLRRVAPVENLRQRAQDQQGPAAPEGSQQGSSKWWWNNAIANRIGQIQHTIYAKIVPLQGDEPPAPPLRHSQGVGDLRARFQQDAQGLAQPPQDPPQNNDQAEQPRGILRRSRPVRDLRVRFANDAGPQVGRGLRTRPRINDLRGRYQADADDDLAL